MKEAIIEFSAKRICWVNIAGLAAIAGSVWWALDSVIFNVLLSAICLLESYDAFRHRNNSITLTEEGIGLDKVSIIDGKKGNIEKCSHVDIEWRYVRRVELHKYNYNHAMEVYAHNKTYLIDTRYYNFFDLQFQLKRWQKAIRDYGHVPCIINHF